jgi:CheY-like chemotaxis protein
MLTGYGYTVIDTGTSPRPVNRRSQPVHLLLTDVVMPIMNGIELAKRRGQQPEHEGAADVGLRGRRGQARGPALV